MEEVRSKEQTEERAGKSNFFQTRTQGLGGQGLRFLGTIASLFLRQSMGSGRGSTGFGRGSMGFGRGSMGLGQGGFAQGTLGLGGFSPYSRGIGGIGRGGLRQDPQYGMGGEGSYRTETEELQAEREEEREEKVRNEKEDDFREEELSLLKKILEKEPEKKDEEIEKKIDQKQEHKDSFQERSKGTVGLSVLGLSGIGEKTGFTDKGTEKTSGAVFSKIFGPSKDVEEGNKQLSEEEIEKKIERKQKRKDFFQERAKDVAGIGLSFLGLGGIEEKLGFINKGAEKASGAVFSKIFGPIKTIEESSKDNTKLLDNMEDAIDSPEPPQKTEAEQYQEVIEKQRVRKETDRDIREGEFEQDQLEVLNQIEDGQGKSLSSQDDLLDKQDQIILGQQKIVKAIKDIEGDGPLDDLFDGKKKRGRKGGKGGFLKKAGGMAGKAGSFLTGGMGLSGMLGTGMTGIASAGTGAILSSVGLAAGAGAIGYGAGTLAQKGISALTGSESWGTDWLMDEPLPDPTLSKEDYKNPEKLRSAIGVLQDQVKEKEGEFWTSGEDEITLKSKKQQIKLYQTLLVKATEKEDVKEQLDDIKDPVITEKIKVAQKQVVEAKRLVKSETASLKDMQESGADKIDIEAKESDVKLAEAGLKQAKESLTQLNASKSSIKEGATLIPTVPKIFVGEPVIEAVGLRESPTRTPDKAIPVVTSPPTQRMPLPLPTEPTIDRSTSIDDLGLVYLNSVLLG